MSPMELATAYSVFPNGGHRVESHFIDKIVDYQNNVIYSANPPTVGKDALVPAPSVMRPQTAYLTTSMLQDVILHGTGRSALQLGRHDLAGKTGTTWVGFDEPKTLKEYAVSSALPMWNYFMGQALKTKANNLQPQPAGLVTVRIDPATGLLARPGQSDAIYEIFTEETAPHNTALNKNNSAISSADNHLLDSDGIF